MTLLSSLQQWRKPFKSSSHSHSSPLISCGHSGITASHWWRLLLLLLFLGFSSLIDTLRCLPGLSQHRLQWSLDMASEGSSTERISCELLGTSFSLSRGQVQTGLYPVCGVTGGEEARLPDRQNFKTDGHLDVQFPHIALIILQLGGSMYLSLRCYLYRVFSEANRKKKVIAAQISHYARIHKVINEGFRVQALFSLFSTAQWCV